MVGLRGVHLLWLYLDVWRAGGIYGADGGGDISGIVERQIGEYIEKDLKGHCLEKKVWK